MIQEELANQKDCLRRSKLVVEKFYTSRETVEKLKKDIAEKNLLISMLKEKGIHFHAKLSL